MTRSNTALAALAGLLRLTHVRKKESTSFLKKRSKKLLTVWAGPILTPGPKSQKFFGSFFQKRTCLLFRRRVALLTYAAVAGFPASSLAAAGAAQALQIMPVRVELRPGQLAATIFVTNKGTEDQTLQLRPFAWNQGSGEDTLVPTRLLAVSPPIIDIEAGATQVFRLVLRQPAADVEASYRLLFDELPPPAVPGLVRMALRISVPVFAAPQAAPEKNVAWTVVLDREGALLTGTNRGNGHLHILDPELTEDDGAAFAVPAAQTAYLLPGAARSWRIKGGGRLQAGSTLRLTAKSDQGPVDAAVHVSGP